MALPSEPRKSPKAPAAELPSRGSRSISKYMNRIWGRIGGYNVGWQRPCMHAIISNQPFSNPFLEEKGIRSLMNRGDRKLPRLLSVPSPCSTFDAGGPMPRTGSVPLSYIAWRSIPLKNSCFPFQLKCLRTTRQPRPPRWTIPFGPPFQSPPRVDGVLLLSPPPPAPNWDQSLFAWPFLHLCFPPSDPTTS